MLRYRRHDLLASARWLARATRRSGDDQPYNYNTDLVTVTTDHDGALALTAHARDITTRIAAVEHSPSDPRPAAVLSLSALIETLTSCPDDPCEWRDSGSDEGGLGVVLGQPLWTIAARLHQALPAPSADDAIWWDFAETVRDAMPFLGASGMLRLYRVGEQLVVVRADCERGSFKRVLPLDGRLSGLPERVVFALPVGALRMDRRSDQLRAVRISEAGGAPLVVLGDQRTTVRPIRWPDADDTDERMVLQTANPCEFRFDTPVDIDDLDEPLCCFRSAKYPTSYLQHAKNALDRYYTASYSLISDALQLADDRTTIVVWRADA